MHAARILNLKEHRGAPRFWTEGGPPMKSGFEPGMHFRVEHQGHTVILRLDPNGPRKVSTKDRGSKTISIIDVNSAEALAPLAGATAVRVVFGPQCIVISRLASEKRRLSRMERVRQKLDDGEPLKTAGIAAGGGILSHAAHAGLAAAGIVSRVAVHNEIREELSTQASEFNDALDDDTQMLAMPLQELAFDEEVLRRVGEVDIIELGLPCSGASVAGRAKRALSMPEEHPDVGHLVVGGLALIARLNPLVCVFENVPPYAKSASAVLIRHQLRDLGYICHERELFGPDFGALEARKRWCLVGVTRGIDFNFDTLLAENYPVPVLADVLEDPEDVLHKWSTMPGLKAKEIRDKDAGKGFAMQIYTGVENRINTLTKGIAKNRSTDPKIQHPDYPELLRIPTAREHARCKQVPEQLVQGLSETTAHEVLGQGIVYEPFRRVFEHIGAALNRWHASGSNDGLHAYAFKAAA